MYLIDTNIHAAYILKTYENDKLTQQYVSFYSTIALTYRIVPDFILNEFEIFITRVAPSKYHLTAEQKPQLRQAVFEYIRDIKKSFTLVTTPMEVYKSAFDIYFLYAKDSYISFTDSLLLALARNGGYTLLTKDNRLQTIAKELRIAFYKPQEEK